MFVLQYKNYYCEIACVCMQKLEKEYEQLTILNKKESEKISIELKDINNNFLLHQKEREDLSLTRIALSKNVENSELKLKKLIYEKKKFASMKDISQLKPHIVFYILKYMNLFPDFINCLISCKAWNHSLNRSMYWRLLRKEYIIINFINPYKEYKKEKIKNKLLNIKRINHAFMQLKIENKVTKNNKELFKKKKNNNTKR